MRAAVTNAPIALDKHINIFAYDDYKEFVLNRMKLYPNEGYGQFRKFAKALNMSTASVSLIFKGDRHLMEEKALEAALYFGLSGRKTDYFLLLVQYAVAGSAKLKKYYQEKIAQMREQQNKLANRVVTNLSLSEHDKAIYYSEWLYAAIRVCLALPNCQSVDAISQVLKVSPMRVSQALEFLVSVGIINEKQGTYHVNEVDFHLEPDSPYIMQRQLQWRIKAMRFMEENRLYDHKGFFFTAPMSISKKSADEFHAKIIDLILSLKESVAKEKPEVLFNFNIDWFPF